MVNCASVGEKRNSAEFQLEDTDGTEMKKPRMENENGDNKSNENPSLKANKSATEDLKTKIRKYLEENRYDLKRIINCSKAHEPYIFYEISVNSN